MSRDLHIKSVATRLKCSSSSLNSQPTQRHTPSLHPHLYKPLPSHSLPLLHPISKYQNQHLHTLQLWPGQETTLPNQPISPHASARGESALWPYEPTTVSISRYGEREVRLKRHGENKSWDPAVCSFLDSHVRYRAVGWSDGKRIRRGGGKARSAS